MKRSDSNEEWEYALQENTKSDARDRINTYLAAGGDLGSLDLGLISASGLSSAELSALQEAAAAALTNQKKSGGGGGGSGTPVGAQDEAGDINDLYIAAKASGNPYDYINKNYKNFGYKTANGLISGYDEWAGSDSVASKDDRNFYTNFDFSQDEGIFRWNGKNYNTWYSFLSAVDKANLSDSELKTLEKKVKSMVPGFQGFN